MGEGRGGEDMSTCKSCVFWGRYRDKVCDAISLGEADNEPYIDVRVADDHGLDADFVTTPDFGCTLFHAKGSAQ